LLNSLHIVNSTGYDNNSLQQALYNKMALQSK
jgi:hypothetical protein